MKLDLTALSQGIEEEFVKKAAPLNTAMYNGVRTMARPAAATATKSLVPALARTGVKTVAKYAPGIGGLVHGGFAVNDALHGDWTGAAMNTGAGLAAGFGLTPLAIGIDVANAGRQLTNGASNMVGKAVGTVGKYAPLAMAGMAALSGAGNKNQQQPTMNYGPYAPRPRSILDTTNMDPHSLGAPQMFAEKLAAHLKKKASLSDAFAAAASRKVIDAAFSAATPHPAMDPVAQKAKEKEIEITSHYPEIAQMLKDDQNKAYLEKLLKA